MFDLRGKAALVGFALPHWRRHECLRSPLALVGGLDGLPDLQLVALECHLVEALTAEFIGTQVLAEGDAPRLSRAIHQVDATVALGYAVQADGEVTVINRQRPIPVEIGI